jgi:hypothetical protein
LGETDFIEIETVVGKLSGTTQTGTGTNTKILFSAQTESEKQALIEKD